MSAPKPLNNRAPDPLANGEQPADGEQLRENLARKHRAEAFKKRMRGEGDCGCGKVKTEEPKP